MPNVHLVVSDQVFEVETDETIMEGAERAGIFLAHSCLSGTCRACMTRLISGVVEHDPEYIDELNIDPYEVGQGYRLLCSSFARTDITLEK